MQNKSSQNKRENSEGKAAVEKKSGNAKKTKTKKSAAGKKNGAKAA